MTIEYIVTMSDGRELCHVLPIGKPYECRGDEVSVEIAAVVL